MKLNKQQQRRIAANLADKIEGENGANVATVVSHLGYQLILSYAGRLISADWRRQSGDVACNDRVMVRNVTDNHAVVEAILPRQQTLYKWQGRKKKAIASHLDQILILIAPAPAWQENLVDRYLIAARDAGIAPALLLNKTDLLSGDDAATLATRLAPYRALGMPIFDSALLPAACAPPALLEWLRGATTIICGQSGVGKSSLVRVLKPDCDVWIQAISHASQLGKHTTTNLRRYPLDATSAIIDTPGVRGLALDHLPRETIVSAFPDITAHAAQCRFNDCDHHTAPACAVVAAVERGEIARARYESLLQLLNEGRR